MKVSKIARAPQDRRCRGLCGTLFVGRSMAEEPPPPQTLLSLTGPDAASSSSTTTTPWYVNGATVSKVSRPMARELGVDYARTRGFEYSYRAERENSERAKRKKKARKEKQKLKKNTASRRRPTSSPSSAICLPQTAT